MTRPQLEPVAPGLHLSCGFLEPREQEALLQFLDRIPCIPYKVSDRERQFAFTRPVFDGEPLRGRAEACAGSPVWLDRVTAGAPIPEALETIRELLNDDLATAVPRCYPGLDWRELTSVYVDRYDNEGRFVAHTDRAMYGSFVVGLSVGTGFGDLSFEDGSGSSHIVRVEPRSLYVMGPPLRYQPWVHSFRLLEGTRYAITFRAAADLTTAPS